MGVHTCVVECARNAGYICHWVEGGGGSYFRGCTSGGVYVSCVYSYEQLELP